MFSLTELNLPNTLNYFSSSDSSSESAEQQNETDPIDQLSNDFDLQEVKSLFRYSHNKSITQHIRAKARDLLLKLQDMRNLGETPQRIQEVGRAALKELKLSSEKMTEDYIEYQSNSRERDHQHSLMLRSLSEPLSSPSPLKTTSRRSNSSLIQLIRAPLEKQQSRQSADVQTKVEVQPYSTLPTLHFPTYEKIKDCLKTSLGPNNYYLEEKGLIEITALHFAGQEKQHSEIESEVWQIFNELNSEIGLRNPTLITITLLFTNALKNCAKDDEFV